MMTSYTLAEEPRGDVYRALIHFAVHRCTKFSVVVRDTLEDDHPRKVLDSLKVHEISDTVTSEWPGTRLLSGTAHLYYFALNDVSASLLNRFTDGLYGWLAPELPEDLCLYRPDGSLWLGTISHESDGFFELSAEEFGSLMKSVPGLKLVADDD